MSDERLDELNRYMAGKEPSVDASTLAMVGILIVITVWCVCYVIGGLPL